MRPRRGATELAGVLLVDKPSGPTSHDVVSELRSASGERRIGHAGTLDPMATGLLLVLLGRATRLEQYFVGHDKRYEARIVFGTGTDTLDAEGAVVRTDPVPAEVLDGAFAAAVLARFLGEQEQVPPDYSAIKRGGVAAHRLARAGEKPVLDARLIEVYEASLIGIESDPPAWRVTFAVSKGTYIRSLARDIGTAAGTCAHLGALRRTSIGSCDVGGALPLSEAVDAARAGVLETRFTDPVPLLGMRAINVDPRSVADGRTVPCDDPTVAEGDAVAMVTSEVLLGVYRRRGVHYVAECVLGPGVHR